MSDKKAFKSGFATLIGRPNVGKSTLMNHLIGQKIAITSNKPQTTRNRICGIVTRGNTQFVFVDTPGYHRSRTKLGEYMVNVARESIADVDATILVVEPIASIGPQEEGLIEKINGSKSYPRLLFFAILLPLAPDNFLCYFSGLMNMPAKKFITIIITAKPWCILFYSIFFAYFL